MSRKPLPTIPSWTPPAVARLATDIYESLEGKPAESFEILSRLISDARMRNVWIQIYKRRRINHKTSDAFVHATSLTFEREAALMRDHAIESRGRGDQSEAKIFEYRAKQLDRASKNARGQWWSEQDLAAQEYLGNAFYTAVYSEPLSNGDFVQKEKKLRSAKRNLEAQLNVLASVNSNYLAEQLRALITGLDEEAKRLRSIIKEIEKGDDAYQGITRRKRSDPKLRNFVAQMSRQSERLFKAKLDGIVATLTSVVFRKDIDRGMVRRITRTRDVRRR